MCLLCVFREISAFHFYVSTSFAHDDDDEARCQTNERTNDCLGRRSIMGEERVSSELFIDVEIVLCFRAMTALREGTKNSSKLVVKQPSPTD